MRVLPHLVRVIAAAVLVTACSSVALWAQSTGARGLSRVRGVVFDSVGRGPLGGATVQLLAVSERRGAATFAARADSNGTFAIDSVPPGAYLAGFYHPAADSLGIEPEPRRVFVVAREHELELGIPSPGSLIRAMCGTAVSPDSTTLLLGHVRDARDEAPVVDASVRVEWMETTIDRTGVKSRDRSESAGSRASGFFWLCSLPGDLPLLARASRGADSTGYLEVDVPLGGVKHVTLLIGASTRREARLPSDSLPSVWRGNARVAGRILDADGRVVAGARAVLIGTGAEGIANAAGAFAIDSAPTGSFMLELRAIGYQPVRQLVQLLDGRSVSLSLALGAKIFTLPTGIVRGEMVYSRALEGFDRRRRTQFTGKFLSPREISARPRSRLGVLLQGMQGVEVTQRGSYSMVVMRRIGGPALEYCAPSLYVDGARDLTDDYDRIFSDQVMAVEIYVRPLFRPAEFTDRNDCGAIAVWLRPANGGIRPPGAG